MGYHVRMAVLEDALPMATIIHDALGYDAPERVVAVQLGRLLLRTTDRVWVVCNENGIVGLIHASDYETLHAGSMKNIILLAVDEAHRGHGLGRQLVSAVEDWAISEGCMAVRLVSSAFRPQAHQFYTHCGYQLRKQQMNFIKYLPASTTND